MDIKGNLKKYLEDSCIDTLGEIVLLRSVLKAKEELLEKQKKVLERIESETLAYEDKELNN